MLSSGEFLRDVQASLEMEGIATTTEKAAEIRHAIVRAVEESGLSTDEPVSLHIVTAILAHHQSLATQLGGHKPLKRFLSGLGAAA